MQREPAAKLRGRLGLILLVAAAAAVWWGLDRSEPRAGWLRVEAPRRAVAGQPLPVRVHLAPQSEAGYLCADLHWGASRDASMGYLASGGNRAVGKEGGTFDFEIVVLPRAGLRFVNGIIYLSRKGSWQTHTLVAGTEAIPVVSDTAAKQQLPLEQLHVQPLAQDLHVRPRPAPIPRLLTALLFLAATVVAWGARQSPADSGGAPGSENRWWLGLAGLLALACLWEFFRLESRLDAQARAMAQARDLYYLRALLQKVVISVAVAATAAFLLLVRRARSSRRLLLVGVGLYLGISAVNLVSLHAVDQVANLAWHGLKLVQALKLACAAMILRGVVTASREHSGAGR
jgi:hypothetical protein